MAGEALTAVLVDASDCATARIIELEDELVEWFMAEGVNVHEVDRAPFIEAVRALHNGPMAS